MNENVSTPTEFISSTKTIDVDGVALDVDSALIAVFAAGHAAGIAFAILQSGADVDRQKVAEFATSETNDVFTVADVQGASLVSAWRTLANMAEEARDAK